METHTKEKWHWEDLLSSYKFWGLLLYYILSSALIRAMMYPALYEKARTKEFSHSLITSGGAILDSGFVIGFVFAWFLSKTRFRETLFLFGLTLIASINTIYFSNNALTISICLFLTSTTISAIFIYILSIISEATARSSSYVVAIGVLLSLTNLFTPQLTTAALLTPSLNLNIYTVMSISIILGILLTLPINPELFGTPPEKRGRALDFKKRNPKLISILCLFIPFYFLYWIYRQHGEVRSLEKDTKILSSKASVWLIIAIPFIYPILLSSLKRHIINSSEIEFSKGKTFFFNITCLFLPFISAALIQSSINLAMARKSELKMLK